MMSANAFKIVLRFSSLYFAPASAKLNIHPTPKPQHTGTPVTQSLSTRAFPSPKPPARGHTLYPSPLHTGTPVTQAPCTRAHPSPKPSTRGHTPSPKPQHAGTPVTQAPARGHTRHPSPQHTGTSVTQSPAHGFTRHPIPSTRAHLSPNPQHTGIPVTQALNTWAHSDTPALILPPSIRLILPFKHSSSLWRSFFSPYSDLLSSLGHPPFSTPPFIPQNDTPSFFFTFLLRPVFLYHSPQPPSQNSPPRQLTSPPIKSIAIF